MAIREVLQFPNSLLRTKSVDVELITQDTADLVIDLLETMLSKNGLGISAPQVGVFQRIIVINGFITNKVGHLALINPYIVESSVAKQTYAEGCLSFPGLILPVRRPTWVQVRTKTMNGDWMTFDASGLLGEVVMHEIEHLDGNLLIDYASRQVRRSLERKYGKESADLKERRARLNTKEFFAELAELGSDEKVEK